MFPVKPLETLLFATGSVAVGTFDCRPDHPLFADTGPSSTYCFVFPRTSTWIRHLAHEPFLGTPNISTLYNEGQSYCRQALSPEGDRSDWFAIAPGILEDVLAGIGLPPARGSRRLFREAYVASDASTYVRQRQLVNRLLRREPAEPLAVEETVIELLETLLRNADRRDPYASTPVTRRQQALVDDAKRLLVARVRDRMEVADLADRVDCSVYHLCRTFKRIEGITIHAYQNQLRLRGALDSLVDHTAGDITALALDLGYSSHSHFTAAFRSAFGLTPSRYAAASQRGGAMPLDTMKMRPE